MTDRRHLSLIVEPERDGLNIIRCGKCAQVDGTSIAI